MTRGGVPHTFMHSHWPPRDGRLRVRDGRGGRIAGLRVVDAGAMPTITSGNTNSPTLMMAEKAAAWVREAAATSDA